MKQDNYLWGCKNISSELKSRKIVTWCPTENPNREFGRQQIIDLAYDNDDSKTLIFDNALQFTSFDYSD